MKNYDGFVVCCALSPEELDLTLGALGVVWETAPVFGMGEEGAAIDPGAFDRIVEQAHRLSEARYHLVMWDASRPLPKLHVPKGLHASHVPMYGIGE